MGLYDTIVLERQFFCPTCGRRISSVQVKDFDPYLNTYRVGDCISDPDDIRLIKKELFCDACGKFTGEHVYVAIARGILVGSAKNLEEAERLIGSINIEKLLLLYRSTYKKYRLRAARQSQILEYLYDLTEWYGRQLYKKDENDPERRWFFGAYKFEGIETPLEALAEFLAEEKIVEALDDLTENRQAILDIYYIGDIKEGDEIWSVDVRQDEISQEYGIERIWIVVSQKKLGLDKNEKNQPERVIVTEKPFSSQAVIDAVQRWLKDRNYTFSVRLVAKAL
jgi:hypothetical protein